MPSTLLHVSTLSCHHHPVYSQYLAKSHTFCCFAVDTINTITVYITTISLCHLHCYMFRHCPVIIKTVYSQYLAKSHTFCCCAVDTINTTTVYITTICLGHLRCYMFRHCPVTIKQFTANTSLSHTYSAVVQLIQ